jgi:Putative addiction module component
MNDKVKILIDEVRKLTETERERLIHALDVEFGAAIEDIDQAWIEEAERRSIAYSKGEMKAYDADEVLADLKVRLARRRSRA